MESMVKLLLRSNATDFTGNIRLWINEFQRPVCGLEPWFFNENDETIASTLSSITLTKSFARMTAVWRTSGTLSPLELIAYDAGSENLLPATGLATHYRSTGPTNLIVKPTDGTSISYRVAGHTYLADFVNPSDENVLSIVAPYLLIFGACIEGAIHLGRDPSLWKARADEQIAILRETHSKRARSQG